MLNVHDENLHITNDRAKDFPEPEVAVDDAWNEMKSQLDAEMPNSSVPSFSEKLIGGMGHSLNSLLIVLGIAGALTLALIYFINKSDKSVELSDPGFTVPDSDSAIIQEESITSSKDIETSVTELLINKQDNYLNTATFADILPGDDKKSASAFSGDSIAIKPSDSTKVDQVNNQKDRNLKLLVLPADQVNDKKVKTKINRLTIRNQFWEKINFGLYNGCYDDGYANYN